jgi:hypothetical protein
VTPEKRERNYGLQIRSVHVLVSPAAVPLLRRGFPE